MARRGGKISVRGEWVVKRAAVVASSGQTSVSGTSDITGKFTLLTNGEANGQQVLYNNWPMYYWIKDKQPGDTTGEGIGGKGDAAPPRGAAGGGSARRRAGGGPPAPATTPPTRRRPTPPM